MICVEVTETGQYPPKSYPISPAVRTVCSNNNLRFENLVVDLVEYPFLSVSIYRKLQAVSFSARSYVYLAS